MLEAIVNGEQDSQRLAEMAQGKLRNKIPELQEALQGRVSRHHRFLLRELLDHHHFVESKMQRIEQEVAERLGKNVCAGTDGQFSDTPGAVGSIPRPGEHNEEIYCSILGHPREELARWKEEGVI